MQQQELVLNNLTSVRPKQVYAIYNLHGYRYFLEKMQNPRVVYGTQIAWINQVIQANAGIETEDSVFINLQGKKLHMQLFKTKSEKGYDQQVMNIVDSDNTLIVTISQTGWVSIQQPEHVHSKNSYNVANQIK